MTTTPLLETSPMRSFFSLLLIVAAAQASAARAEERGAGSVGGTIGQFFEGVGLRNAPPPAADFVERSRPAELDYAPFADPASRPDAKKNREDAAARQKELEAAVAANRVRAARVRTPDVPKARSAARDSGAHRP
jgi:hypothetical protein